MQLTFWVRKCIENNSLITKSTFRGKTFKEDFFSSFPCSKAQLLFYSIANHNYVKVDSKKANKKQTARGKANIGLALIVWLEQCAWAVQNIITTAMCIFCKNLLSTLLPNNSRGRTTLKKQKKKGAGRPTSRPRLLLHLSKHYLINRSRKITINC